MKNHTMHPRAVSVLGLILAVMLLLSVPGTGFAEGEILKRGDTGEAVLLLQLRLKELGYNDTETDGTFGEGTEKALCAFQQRNDLLKTGMADAVTQRVLFS